MGRYSFGRDEHLRKRREFKKVYSQGKAYANRFAVFYVSPNGLERRRMGVSVSKKVGSAVKRSRIKRLFREVYRLNKDRLIEGIDMVLIARKEANDLGFQKAEDALMALFRRARILQAIEEGKKSG